LKAQSKDPCAKSLKHISQLILTNLNITAYALYWSFFAWIRLTLWLTCKLWKCPNQSL